MLAVIGFVIPYIFFIPFVLENGLNIGLLLSELFSNKISSFFGVDVIISAIVLIFFIVTDSRKHDIKNYCIPIVGTLLVGVSFGLPLYLYLKSLRSHTNS